MGTVTRKKEKIKKYKCVTNGFRKSVCPLEQSGGADYITVQTDEILESDEGGCIKKNGVPICNKDSNFGRFHFRECNENGAVKKSKKKKRRIKRGK